MGIKKVAKELNENSKIKNIKKIVEEEEQNEANLRDIFNSAREKFEKIIENHREISETKAFLEKIKILDLKEKVKAAGNIKKTLEKMKNLSRELKREIEGKEILEIEVDKNFKNEKEDEDRKEKNHEEKAIEINNKHHSKGNKLINTIKNIEDF